MFKRKEDTQVKGYFRGGRMVRSHNKKVLIGKEDDASLKRKLSKKQLVTGGLGLAAGIGTIGLGIKAGLRSRAGAKLLQDVSNKLGVATTKLTRRAKELAPESNRLRNELADISGTTNAMLRSSVDDVAKLKNSTRRVKDAARELKILPSMTPERADKAVTGLNKKLQQAKRNLDNLSPEGKKTIGISEDVSEQLASLRKELDDIKAGGGIAASTNLAAEAGKQRVVNKAKERYILEIKDKILTRITQRVNKKAPTVTGNTGAAMKNKRNISNKLFKLPTQKLEDVAERQEDVLSAIDNILNDPDILLKKSQRARLDKLQKYHEYVLKEANGQLEAIDKGGAIRDSLGGMTTGKKFAAVKSADSRLQDLVKAVNNTAASYGIDANDIDDIQGQSELSDSILNKIKKNFWDKLDDEDTGKYGSLDQVAARFKKQLLDLGILTPPKTTKEEQEALDRIKGMMDEFSQGRVFGEVYFCSDISLPRLDPVSHSRKSLSALVEFGLFGVSKPKQKKDDYNKDAWGTAAAVGALLLASKKYGSKKPQPQVVPQQPVQQQTQQPSQTTQPPAVQAANNVTQNISSNPKVITNKANKLNNVKQKRRSKQQARVVSINSSQTA
jgi:hypothetical protein